jgi:hypothetical protein
MLTPACSDFLQLQLRYAIYSAPLDRLNAPKDEYVLAGTLSLIESSVDHMQTEIGWIVILGPFQVRRHDPFSLLLSLSRLILTYTLSAHTS